MSTVAPGCCHTRRAAWPTYAACAAHDTPSSRSGGFVWYPYSVSQSGFGPNSSVTSARIAESFAIVSELHDAHGVRDGVSPGSTAYGLCAYASSRAWAARIPCMNASGAIPLGGWRGEVTPPATRLAPLAACRDAYAGLRSLCTYTDGDTGTEKSRPFGSFQTVHMCTHG